MSFATSTIIMITRDKCIRLSRCFRSAHAFTVEPGPVEAANAALPGSEHRARIFDPARARLWLLGGGDPVDPISARDGRDVQPQRPRKEPEIFSLRAWRIRGVLRAGTDLKLWPRLLQGIFGILPSW